jgi:hypothetical protein
MVYSSKRSTTEEPLVPPAPSINEPILLTELLTLARFGIFVLSKSHAIIWGDPARRIIIKITLLSTFLVMFFFSNAQQTSLTCFSNGGHYTLEGESLNMYVPSTNQEVSYNIWPAGQIVSDPGGYPRWGSKQQPTKKSAPLLYNWEMKPIYEVTYTTMYVGFQDQTAVTAFLTFTLNSKLETRLVRVYVFEENNLQPWE